MIDIRPLGVDGKYQIRISKYQIIPKLQIRKIKHYNFFGHWSLVTARHETSWTVSS